MAGFDIEVNPKIHIKRTVSKKRMEGLIETNKKTIIDWVKNRIENYYDGLTTVDEVTDNIILASSYLEDVSKKMS